MKNSERKFVLFVCLLSFMFVFSSCNSTQKIPPKNAKPIPSPEIDEEKLPTELKHTGDPKIDFKVCEDGGQLQGEMEVKKYIWYFPPISIVMKFKYTLTVNCADGDDDCFTCSDGTADLKLTFTGSADGTVYIAGISSLSVNIDDISKEFAVNGIDKRNCNGNPQPIELSDEGDARWHCAGRTGLVHYDVTFKGSVQGCCESASQCYGIKFNQYEGTGERDKSSESKESESGDGGGAGENPQAGNQIQENIIWKKVKFVITPPIEFEDETLEINYTPIDPVTQEPMMVFNPDNPNELIPKIINMTSPTENYHAVEGQQHLNIQLVDSGLYFIRGNTNEDWVINLGDAMEILAYLYNPDYDEAPLLDAFDTNDNGEVNIGDAVYLLSYMFLGGSPPPPPFANLGIGQSLFDYAGPDLTVDNLPEQWFWIEVPVSQEINDIME